MFCPQCGKPLPDDTCICPDCHINWQEEITKIELAPVVAEKNAAAGEQPPSVPAPSEAVSPQAGGREPLAPKDEAAVSPAPPKEEPEPQTPPMKEEKAASFVPKEVVAEAVPEDDEDEDQADDLVMHWPEEEAPVVEKEGMTLGRGVVYAFCAIVCFIVLVVMIANGIASNDEDSAEYKLDQAILCVQNGDLDEAKDYLEELYSDQAIALKRFVALEEAVPTYEKGRYDVYYSDELDSFYSEMELLTDYHYDALPEFAKQKVDGYRAAMALVENFTYADGEFAKALFEAQCIFENEIERNQSSGDGPFYTISDMKKRLDSAKTAVEQLEEYCYQGVELRQFGSNIGFYYEAETVLLDTPKSSFCGLLKGCRSEVDLEEIRVETSLEQFEAHDELYQTMPDPDYSYDLPDPLTDAKDGVMYATYNTQLVLEEMRVELLYRILVKPQRNLS